MPDTVLRRAQVLGTRQKAPQLTASWSTAAALLLYVGAPVACSYGDCVQTIPALDGDCVQS